MKRLFNIVPLVATALLFAGCGETSETPEAGGSGESSHSSADSGHSDHSSDTEPSDTPADPSSDIVDTAVAADGFNTLVAAVKAAGLVETLKGEGPFTVFAPTDAAFEALPEGTLDDLLKPENKEKLTSILTYHVVSGKVMAADVVNLTSAKTVQGGEVSVSVEGETVKIGGATVSATDIECSNGVIHVIDAVLLPSN